MLRKSQLKYVKQKARKQEKLEKKAQRRLKAQEEADAESTHSSESRGTTSTVVEEAAPIAKDRGEGLNIPALPCPPVMDASGLTIATSPTGHPGSPDPTQPNEDPKEGSNKRVSSKLSTSLDGLRLKVSETMSEWTHKIFGREDEFSKDWESQELEAWVLRTKCFDSDPIKVPFGHQRLQYGLKQIRSKKSSSMGRTTFARYINGGSCTHTLVPCHQESIARIILSTMGNATADPADTY